VVTLVEQIIDKVDADTLSLTAAVCRRPSSTDDIGALIASLNEHQKQMKERKATTPAYGYRM